MPTPTIPALAGSTVNRKWVTEVDTGTSTPTYVPIGGVTACVPNFDQANNVDDSDFGGGGYDSTTKTAASWSIVLTCRRAPKQSDLTSYDVGQEFCRSHAEGVFGPANTVKVRIYEYDVNDPTGLYTPRVLAYSGRAAVQFSEVGGDDKAISTATITLSGQGKITPITHPYPAG